MSQSYPRCSSLYTPYTLSPSNTRTLSEIPTSTYSSHGFRVSD